MTEKDVWANGGEEGGMAYFAERRQSSGPFSKIVFLAHAWDARRVNWHASRSPRVCPSFSIEASLVSGFLSGPVDPREVTTTHGQLVPGGAGGNKAGKLVTVCVDFSCGCGRTRAKLALC